MTSPTEPHPKTKLCPLPPKELYVSKKGGKFIPPGGDQSTQWEKKWFWTADTQRLHLSYCQGQQGSAVNTSSSTHI